MAVTRATIEEELLQELGPYAAISKLDSVTKDGANKSLEGPIRQAVLDCGGSIVEWPFVTDADIATVTSSPQRLVYFAIYRLLLKVWGNWAKVDLKAGEDEQKLSQLADRLQKRIEAIKEEIKDSESIEDGVTEVGPPDIGVIKVGRDRYPLDPLFF